MAKTHPTNVNENASQYSSEISFYPSLNHQDQLTDPQPLLWEVWGKGNPCSLLVRLQTVQLLYKPTRRTLQTCK